MHLLSHTRWIWMRFIMYLYLYMCVFLFYGPLFAWDEWQLAICPSSIHRWIFHGLSECVRQRKQQLRNVCVCLCVCAPNKVGMCVLFIIINHLDKDVCAEFILTSWKSRASEHWRSGWWCNGPHWQNRGRKREGWASETLQSFILHPRDIFQIRTILQIKEFASIFQPKLYLFSFHGLELQAELRKEKKVYTKIMNYKRIL